MNARIGSLLLSLVLAVGVGTSVGCSTRTWYEGFKFRAQNECHRLPQGEVESCLSRVNSMTYEDYERKRQGQNQ
jgi:hypothetical protein